MSTVMRPVGPEPPAVYWLRRAMLGLGLIVLIIVLAFACSGGSGGGKPASLQTTPSPTTQPTDTPSGAISPTIGTSQPATPAVTACRAGEVSVKLTTDSEQYTVGETPKLTATITNSSSSTCTADLSDAQREFTIKSGSDRIWSTSGCKSVTTRHLKLHPGHFATISLFWNGKRNDTSCVTGVPAERGYYVFRGQVDGVTGQAMIFRIVDQ